MNRGTQTLLVIGALVSGSVATYGCNRTPSDAHNDAVEAQHEADQKTADAKQEADKKLAEANADAQKALDEARAKAAEAQATANEKIRDANRVIVGKQGDVRDWAQHKLDDVNSMIDDAKAKAQEAKPVAKTRFNTAIEDVQKQRDVLQTEVASIEEHAGDKLDKTKEQFSERVDHIKDRIRSIEKSL
jgi:F0F1-type ATP synthase membrane subunit b/b'